MASRLTFLKILPMNKHLVTLAVAALATFSTLSAQDLETGYFLGGNPFAFRLNPAFQSERNILSVGLGRTGVGLSSNLGASTLVYPMDGKLYLCLNDHVPADEFLGKLQRKNYLDLDAQVNLLTVGFWSGKNFFTVDFNVRSMEMVSLPYDFFRFLKGDKRTGDVFEIASTGLLARNFAEAAFGWSRSFGALSVGARGKFIAGLLAADVMLDKMKVTVGEESWSVESQGVLNISSPAVQTDVVKDTDLLNPNSFRLDWNKAGPAGWGGALDLGVRYDVNPYLSLSAALLDLGLVRWNHETAYATPDKAHEWAPSADDVSAQTSVFKTELSALLELAMDFVSWKKVADPRPAVAWMPFRVHAGAEFRMPFYDRLSVGALYQGRFVDGFARHSGRVSLNWNPLDFLSLSGSATVCKFGDSLGFILNLHPNAVNFLIGCDYIPLHVVSIAPLIDNLEPKYARFAVIPRDRLNLNLYVGLNIAFGRNRLDHAKRFVSK